MLTSKRIAVTVIGTFLVASSVIEAAAADKPLWETPNSCESGWVTLTKVEDEGDLADCETGRQWKKCVFKDKTRYAHWCPPKSSEGIPKGFKE